MVKNRGIPAHPTKGEEEKPPISSLLPWNTRGGVSASSRHCILAPGLASPLEVTSEVQSSDTPLTLYQSPIQQGLGNPLQHLFYPFSATSVRLQSKFGLCKNVRGPRCRLVSGTGATAELWERIHSPLTAQAPSRAKGAELTQILPNPSSLFPQEFPKSFLHNHHAGLRQ